MCSLPNYPSGYIDDISSRMDPDDKWTIIALAHISGWSAEKISIVFKGKMMRVNNGPLVVYMMHQEYISSNSAEKVSQDTSKMNAFLKTKGFNLETTGRPMSELRGKQPCTVAFAKKWHANRLEKTKLCPHYSSSTRINTINHLLSQDNPLEHLAVLSPHEEIAVWQCGNAVSDMIKFVLDLYVGYLLRYIAVLDCWKGIKWEMHADSITTAMRIFKGHWENYYGIMAEHPKPLPEHIHDGTIHIASTGQGAQVLLGLILSNRAAVADKHREWYRLDIGFLPVNVNELPQDSKDCSICRDPLEVENEEGRSEDAIRLIFCCGQVIGRRCLEEWLETNDVKASCPNCRANFSTSFIHKLLKLRNNGEEMNGYIEADAAEDDEGEEESETDAYESAEGGDIGSEAEAEGEEEA